MPRKLRLFAIPGTLYAIALFAGFLGPYSYETQNRELAFAPPSKLRFIDALGRIHIRPFLYAMGKTADSSDRYVEDRSAKYPVYLLVEGEPYTLFGLFHARVHLFGTAPGGRIFVLGTDGLGRDVFSRLVYGAQVSLIAALLGTVVSVSLGLILGGFAGYYGKWIGDIIMRVAEVFLSVPWLHLLLAIRACLPLHLNPSAVFMLLMLVAGLAGWGRPARLVRGIVLSERNREYVLAAKGFGGSDLYILFKHILPQAYGVSLTQAALYIPQYVTAEVTLSFFGLGVSEPVPSWGNMLAQLRTLFVLENCWWMFAPAFALVLLLLAFQWLFRVQQGRLSVEL